MKSILFDGTKAIPLEALDRMLFTELFADSDSDISEKKAYQVVAWLYRAVQLRANAISSIPFVITDDFDEPIEDLPFADDLPRMLQLTEAGLSLFGEAYWMKDVNLANLLLDLRWLVAETIKPMFDAREGLTHFERRVGGQVFELHPDELCYFWYPDPTIEVGPGQSPASVALDAAGLAHNINLFAGGFFKRGAIYPTILTVEGNPPRGELDKLEAWWKKLIGGVKSAWDTVALRANVNVVTLSQEIEKMAMPELTESVRQQIAVAFGIPQTMLEDAANFATAEEHRLSFWRDTIVPESNLIAGTLNEQLFGPMGLTFLFLTEEIEALQQDETEKADSLVRLVETGIISANEARAMLNISERAMENDEGRELDLRRWRTVALKAFKAGQDPALRSFKTSHLRAGEQGVIVDRLARAKTREEVRAAFAPPFRQANIARRISSEQRSG